jgi:hypothetical protein
MTRFVDFAKFMELVKMKKGKTWLYCDESVLWCEWKVGEILACGEPGKKVFHVGFVTKYNPKLPVPELYLFHGKYIFDVDNPNLEFAFDNDKDTYGPALATRVGDFIIYKVKVGNKKYLHLPFTEDGLVERKVVLSN